MYANEYPADEREREHLESIEYGSDDDRQAPDETNPHYAIVTDAELERIETEFAADIAAIAARENRITDLVERIRAVRERRAALDTQEDAAKDELRALLEARGENWADEQGYARINPASQRVSYETKGLDSLIITAPDKFWWLKEYRKVTEVKPSLAVK